MKNTITAWKYWNNFVPCLDKGDEWAVMVYLDLNAYTDSHNKTYINGHCWARHFGIRRHYSNKGRQ